VKQVVPYHAWKNSLKEWHQGWESRWQFHILTMEKPADLRGQSYSAFGFLAS
jgi:hypothetical protein